MAGEHGAPTFGVFNVERFNLCRRQLSDYRCVTIPGEALSDCGSESAIRERLDGLLNLASMQGVFWVGGDLGYSQDPTEITVWREEDAVFHSGNLVTQGEVPHESPIVETRKVMRLVLRVRLEHVAYPIIAEALACIDRFYKPHGLGVDNGGNGGAVVQELLTLDKYRKQGFGGRLHGVDFGGTSVLGFQDNGEPLKKPTKEYMTQLLVGAFQNLTILLPLQDPDLEAEFITHTYTLANGRVTYSKGHDHIIDSARCAFLVRDRVHHPTGRTRLAQNHRGIKGGLRVMNGLKGKDGASAARLITGIEEVRQHFRIRETFREQVSASERRRRYARKLRDWEEIVRLAA